MTVRGRDGGRLRRYHLFSFVFNNVHLHAEIPDPRRNTVYGTDHYYINACLSRGTTLFIPFVKL